MRPLEWASPVPPALLALKESLALLVLTRPFLARLARPALRGRWAPKALAFAMSARSQPRLSCLPLQRRAMFTPFQRLSRSIPLSGTTPLRDGWMLARSKVPRASKAPKAQSALLVLTARMACPVKKAHKVSRAKLALLAPMARLAPPVPLVLTGRTACLAKKALRVQMAPKAPKVRRARLALPAPKVTREPLALKAIPEPMEPMELTELLAPLALKAMQASKASKGFRVRRASRALLALASPLRAMSPPRPTYLLALPRATFMWWTPLPQPRVSSGMRPLAPGSMLARYKAPRVLRAPKALRVSKALLASTVLPALKAWQVLMALRVTRAIPAR